MKHGIVVYEIIDNGKILNGIFADDSAAPYEIFGETAIKQPEEEQINSNSKNIVGNYRLLFRGTLDAYDGDMEIRFNNGVYELEQTSSRGGNFKGIGFMSGANHISFSYWEV